MKLLWARGAFIGLSEWNFPLLDWLKFGLLQDKVYRLQDSKKLYHWVSIWKKLCVLFILFQSPFRAQTFVFGANWQSFIWKFLINWKLKTINILPKTLSLFWLVIFQVKQFIATERLLSLFNDFQIENLIEVV